MACPALIPWFLKPSTLATLPPALIPTKFLQTQLFKPNLQTNPTPLGFRSTHPKVHRQPCCKKSPSKLPSLQIKMPGAASEAANEEPTKIFLEPTILEPACLQMMMSAKSEWSTKALKLEFVVDDANCESEGGAPRQTEAGILPTMCKSVGLFLGQNRGSVIKTII